MIRFQKRLGCLEISTLKFCQICKVFVLILGKVKHLREIPSYYIYIHIRKGFLFGYILIDIFTVAKWRGPERLVLADILLDPRFQGVVLDPKQLLFLVVSKPIPSLKFGDCETILSFWGPGLFSGAFALSFREGSLHTWVKSLASPSHCFFIRKRGTWQMGTVDRTSNLKTSAVGVMKRFPKMEAAHNRGECKWGDLKRSVFF